VATIHDTAVELVRDVPGEAVGGATVRILCQVRNRGTVAESAIPVSASIDGIPLDTKYTGLVGAGGVIGDYEFKWVPAISNYQYAATVTLTAGPVAGESNTSDNSLIWTCDVTPPPGSISGFVFDSLGIQVEKATVKIIGGEEYGSWETNENGKYILSGLRPGTYDLQASKGDYGHQEAYGIELDAGEDKVGPNFTLGGATQLTASDAANEYPSWSPDGTKIAVVRWKQSEYWGRLYVVNEATGEETLIVGPGKPLTECKGTRPQWTPDGQWLIVCDHYGIWKIDSSDGTPAHLIRGSPAPEGELWWPALSPDGSKIAYIAVNSGEYDLWIGDFDGSSLTTPRLLRTGDFSYLDWSPSSDRIVAYEEGVAGLVLVDPITGDQEVLFDMLTSDYSPEGPSWLPDGSAVVFCAKLAGEVSRDIWLVMADSSRNVVRVTSNPAHEYYADVGPMGTYKIALTST